MDAVNLHCMLKTWIYGYITIQKHFFSNVKAISLLVNFFQSLGFSENFQPLMEWTDLSVSAKEKLWECAAAAVLTAFQ